MIIDAAALVVNSLERVDSMLCLPILSQKDIEKVKKIVADLFFDVQKFNDLVASFKSMRFENNDIDNYQLSEIINNLNAIIRKCIKISKFIVIAAQAHVTNMENEGYIYEKDYE